MKIVNILGQLCYDDIRIIALRETCELVIKRERVCDYINKSLLIELGYEDESALEICLKQLNKACNQIQQ
ncbi:unnamed protein product [Paramecium pentaurelia]|uniref:Uncharacterized protein n=1 Tax=Paramecium pentaurelia TaxID=43138 RepID=A0A8S1TW61_9CILI|nr:unnamed protein product [Paramecium pentaurelia]